jgi:peptidoglycan/LPS O-acetylase OafA/YrhL
MNRVVAGTRQPAETQTTDIMAVSVTDRELPGLAGLRAIAVVVVILSHIISPWFPGRIAVLLFFVVSGFPIIGSLMREEFGMGESLRRFYTLRVCRIFPAYYLLLLVQWACDGQASYGRTPPGETSAFLYLSNYYMALTDSNIPGLVHTGSLAVEEQFYLLWPLIFPAMRRLPKKPIRLIAAGPGKAIYLRV